MTLASRTRTGLASSNADDRVGCWWRVRRSYPSHHRRPLSQIQLVGIKLLTLDELAFAVERGDIGRKELAKRFDLTPPAGSSSLLRASAIPMDSAFETTGCRTYRWTAAFIRKTRMPDSILPRRLFGRCAPSPLRRIMKEYFRVHESPVTPEAELRLTNGLGTSSGCLPGLPAGNQWRGVGCP